LTKLSLSNCQLNYDEDFILEDSIKLKIGKGMEELDLSANPFQGMLGLRSLLRLLVQTESLNSIQLSEIAEASSSCVAVTYDYADPTASYSLHLEHPQHRALLRSLLRRCESLKADPSDLFTWEGGRGDEVLQMWKGSSTVPSEGPIKFSFVLPVEVDGEGHIDEIIKRISEKRKIKVGLVDFTKVAQMYSDLLDGATRLVFLEAVAADMILKLSHVRYLCEVDPMLRGQVIDRCLSCVAGLDKLGGFDLALNTESGSKGGALTGSRAAVINLLLFNPSCPDGQYCLNVGMPSDRRLLDNLIIINQWERARAMKTGRPDLSKHGDHECIRNCTMNGRYREWRSANVQIPHRGEVKLDYCSPFHPKKGTPATDEAVVQQLRVAVENTEAKQSLKVSVLRTVLHRLVLNVEQCGSFLQVFPHPAQASEIRDSARVEAFVLLYTRCNDIRSLLNDSDHGLYSLQHLTREEILTIRRRLGRLRCWAIDRTGEESLIPMSYDQTAFNESGRLTLIKRRSAITEMPTPPTGKPAPTPSKMERMAKAQEDDKRMKPILEDYGMLDNPTSMGNANWFMMDLTLKEDWIAAGALLQCCQAESAEVKDEPYWSEKAHLAQRGSNWLVPDDWNKEVPEVGIFGVRFLQGYHEPNIARRLELAEEWLGW